jgi:thymidylate synthase
VIESPNTIRQRFDDLLTAGQFVTDKTGVRMLEVVGESFHADDDALFGQVSWDYVDREIAWYESQSLRVDDIPGGAPEIWKRVASRQGLVNSNYGWMIYSKDNGEQYENVVSELRRNPESRRAVMIYTRPEMWDDYCYDGMSDFCCTNAVQYLLRDGRLNAVVQLRSNDAVFGYKNDRAWQMHVLRKVAADLNVQAGRLIWNAGSIHVYERHFYLVHHWGMTGEVSITKERFRPLYPDFPYEV